MMDDTKKLMDNLPIQAGDIILLYENLFLETQYDVEKEQKNTND